MNRVHLHINAVARGACLQNMDRAARFDGASWRDAGGKLNRDKLADAVSAAAAKHYGLQARSSTWDGTIGEYTVSLRRPSQVAPGLGLTEILKIVVLIGPETPKSNTRLVLWIQSNESDVVDEGPEPRLAIAGIGVAEDDPNPDPDGSDGLLETLAKELRGEIWDGDKSQWKRP